jgi:hypothetical protein
MFKKGVELHALCGGYISIFAHYEGNKMGKFLSTSGYLDVDIEKAIKQIQNDEYYELTTPEDFIVKYDWEIIRHPDGRKMKKKKTMFDEKGNMKKEFIMWFDTKEELIAYKMEKKRKSSSKKNKDEPEITQSKQKPIDERVIYQDPETGKYAIRYVELVQKEKTSYVKNVDDRKFKTKANSTASKKRRETIQKYGTNVFSGLTEKEIEHFLLKEDKNETAEKEKKKKKKQKKKRSKKRKIQDETQLNSDDDDDVVEDFIKVLQKAPEKRQKVKETQISDDVFMPLSLLADTSEMEIIKEGLVDQAHTIFTESTSSLTNNQTSAKSYQLPNYRMDLQSEVTTLNPTNSVKVVGPNTVELTSTNIEMRVNKIKFMLSSLGNNTDTSTLTSLTAKKGIQSTTNLVDISKTLGQLQWKRNQPITMATLPGHEPIMVPIEQQ